MRLVGAQGLSSEEAGLLHDPEELLLADLAIPIPVRLVDHLLHAITYMV